MKQSVEKLKYFFLSFINYFFFVLRFAALQQDGNDYFILLILTDGIITDMPQTMEAIVNVSAFHIIIVSTL